MPPPGAVTVTFVPPDSGRRLERGHHPAERLAEALAARWQLPCTPLLERTGPPRRQRGLELAERRRNVARAFRATARAPGRVLLVDDVYTSGATVSAAASALRVVGARTIDVVTFARAVRGPWNGVTTRIGRRSEEAGMQLQREGQEPRGERLHPELRGAQARKARQAAERPRSRGGRAGRRAQSVDRREPGGRGDGLAEGTHAARARVVPGHEGVDRRAHRQAPPPDQGRARQEGRPPQVGRQARAAGRGGRGRGRASEAAPPEAAE